ncbi:MAG: hypothetical protein ABFD79_02530 [Phycisphaerales bacterium]
MRKAKKRIKKYNFGGENWKNEPKQKQVLAQISLLQRFQRFASTTEPSSLIFVFEVQKS